MLNSLQNPASFHICLTLRNKDHVDRFVEDLTSVAEAVASEPDDGKSSTASIYGMASSLPAGPVEEVLQLYTDSTLKA